MKLGLRGWGWVLASAAALLLAGCGGGEDSGGAGGDPKMPGTESTGLTTPPAGGSGQAAAPAPTGATEATGGAAAGGASGSPGKVRVTLDTSLGKIKLELDGDKAPITVKNFVEYVKKGQYDGTIFHRVIPGFMVQGGGFTPELDEKPTGPEIKNEAGNGLKNTRGTIAMARTNVVDSATAQFFISVADNVMLDHRDESLEGFGYAVFGKVTEGMDAVDKIVAVPTEQKGPHEAVPVTPVLIKSAKLE